MPKYRVKGSATQINHSWVEEGGERKQKVFTEGEELELEKKVAVNFRHQLEPLDDDGKFDDDSKVPEMKGLRGHEKLQLLQERKKELEETLKMIDAAIKQAEGEAAREVEERQKRAQQAKSAEPKNSTGTPKGNEGAKA